MSENSLPGVWIGRGVFGWDGGERRSDRYGVVNLSRSTFESTICDIAIDRAAAASVNRKRCRLRARVLEARDSGHIGDLFLGIYPSKPDVGEVVDLGVGTIAIQPSWEADGVAVALRPDDGRVDFWIDPRKLYRLHDQTVELFAEPTEEPAEPSFNATRPAAAP